MSPSDLASLGGRLLSGEALAVLESKLEVPQEFVRLATTMPLVGLTFSIPAGRDQSGLGVQMQWLTAEQALSEATDVYPGILATKRGFIPVGMCLEGSGDPYFYRNRDGAIVRIPHDAAIGGSLDESRIELVAPSVEQFLAAASVEGQSP